MTYEVLATLTRSGPERDAFLAHASELGVADVDASLVDDVLRACGRIGSTLATRRALVQTCSVVRSLDAWESGAIELDELAAGLAVHAHRTDRFAAFDEARVTIRTIVEVLEQRAHSVRAVTAQLRVLHAELRGWLVTALTGSADGAVPRHELPDRAGVRAPARVTGEEAVRIDALATELLEGAAHHPVTGVVGTAWVRGWAIVPVLGEAVGDEHGEIARLAAALAARGSTRLYEVELKRSPAWTLDGAQLVPGDGRRPVFAFEPTADGLGLALADRNGACLFTDADGSFLLLERIDHHVVAGTPAFVEAVCGVTAAEALARFRHAVDAMVEEGDDEPPAELARAAREYGRVRRRGRHHAPPGD